MLGPHIQESSTWAHYWAARAPIVKQIDGTDLLKVAPAGATTIFRHWYSSVDQNVNRNGGDVAREIIAQLGGFRPTYIELYNEVGAPEHVGSGLPRYTAFHSEAVQVAHDNGIKVMGYSFGVGSPEPADWDYMRGVQYGGVDAIGLHEYWTGDPQTYDLWNWTAMRHRLVHSWTAGNHPSFYITECGRSDQSGQHGYVDYGFSTQRYASELQVYDGLISQDSYVKGANPFTNGPNSTWQSFNMDPVVPALLGVSPECDPSCCRERTDCLACQNALTCNPVTPTTPDLGWLVGLGIGALAGGLYLAISTPRYNIGKKKIVYYDKRTISAGGKVPPGFVIVK